jgi:hypothetical protein
MLYNLNEKVLDKSSSDLLQVTARAECIGESLNYPLYLVKNLDRPGTPEAWASESDLKKRF